MTLEKIVKAFPCIQELMIKEWDFTTAYSLSRLNRQLRPHIEFYAAEERKLCEKYGAKDENGRVSVDSSGTFSLDSPESRAAFLSARKKLGEIELDEEITPAHVAVDRIKPSLIDVLDGLVIFEPSCEEGDR